MLSGGNCSKFIRVQFCGVASLSKNTVCFSFESDPSGVVSEKL